MGVGESEGSVGNQTCQTFATSGCWGKLPLVLCCCQKDSSGISSSEIISLSKVSLSAELSHSLQTFRHYDSGLTEAQVLSLKGLWFVKYVFVQSDKTLNAALPVFCIKDQDRLGYAWSSVWNSDNAAGSGSSAADFNRPDAFCFHLGNPCHWWIKASFVNYRGKSVLFLCNWRN